MVEICDNKGRNDKYTAGWISWTIGMTILPFIGDWRKAI